MRITPRRDEVKAVVSLLESSDYETADALAKDIIKTVAELMDDREWYALAWRSKPGPDALSLAWGVFSSESEAERFAKKLSIGGLGRIVKLVGAAATLTRVAAHEEVVGKDAGLCSRKGCGHPAGMHKHEKMGGRCALDSCSCASFE